MVRTKNLYLKMTLSFSHARQCLRITGIENAVDWRDISNGRKELVGIRDLRRTLINQYGKQRVNLKWEEKI